MRARLWWIMIIFSSLFILFSPRAQEVSDPLVLIGLPEEKASTLWDDPAELAPGPGPSEREIYFPSRGVTLGIYRNRVWQVRFDETTPMSWNGLSSGMAREEVREILGVPYFSAGTWDLYLLPGGSWPLRLRIFYRGEEACDFYLYRGDF